MGGGIPLPFFFLGLLVFPLSLTIIDLEKLAPSQFLP
jgi:hypothetical protein